MKILSQSQIDFFNLKGYLKLQDVFKEQDAIKLQNEIWDELNAEFGINKANPETWKTPPHSPKKAKFSSTNKKVINTKFRTIIDDLLGEGNWNEPNSWGGFLITFPTKQYSEWNLTDKMWHWDYELNRLFELRGLLIFSFYSKVESKGGGTLIVSGSHRALEKYYSDLPLDLKKMKHSKQRKHFLNWHPYFKLLLNAESRGSNHLSKFMEKESEVDSIPLQVVELTGNPGDVVFCHPRIIHAPAGINLGQQPRIMRNKFLW